MKLSPKVEEIRFIRFTKKSLLFFSYKYCRLLAKASDEDKIIWTKTKALFWRKNRIYCCWVQRKFWKILKHTIFFLLSKHSEMLFRWASGEVARHAWWNWDQKLLANRSLLILVKISNIDWRALLFKITGWDFACGNLHSYHWNRNVYVEFRKVRDKHSWLDFGREIKFQEAYRNPFSCESCNFLFFSDEEVHVLKQHS